jgi:hypothetical protein
LKHRDKPYVTAELFEDYPRSVFVPHLMITRIVEDLREGDAVLLTDNCSPRITPSVIELLSTARVRVLVVPFAPHTRQIFHVLDLTLLGILKRRGQDQLPLEDDAENARFIRKAYHNHDFRMTMTMVEPNIWGAFRGIRVKYSVVYGVQCVSFDEMSLRKSEGFKELWDIDFPVGNLSPIRQSSTFGWINEPEQNGTDPSFSNFSDEAGRYSSEKKMRKSGVLV